MEIDQTVNLVALGLGKFDSYKQHNWKITRVTGTASVLKTATFGSCRFNSYIFRLV